MEPAFRGVNHEYQEPLQSLKARGNAASPISRQFPDRRFVVRFAAVAGHAHLVSKISVQLMAWYRGLGTSVSAVGSFLLASLALDGGKPAKSGAAVNFCAGFFPHD